jgi:hypothetical protein
MVHIFKPVRVNIVSFNLANTTQELSADSTEVLQYDPDIHVEATQEDFRPVNNNSIFGTVLTNKGYGLFDMVSLNQKRTDMNIVLRVYMKYDMLEAQGLTEPQNGKRPLPTQNGQVGLALLKGQGLAAGLPFGTTGFSKGAVWVKVFQPYPMLFINMHLPILKKKGDRGLGFNFRAQKLKEILFLPAVRSLAASDTTVFITGDLNFRINPDQHNQLTNLLSSNIPFLQELPFLRPEDRVITCKFEKGRGEACAEARKLQPVFPGGPPLPAGMDYCVDEKRTPSRCDRILYHPGNSTTVKVLQHKGADLFDDSDHNALFATVEVTGFSRNAAKFPAWGSAQQIAQLAEQQQNTTSNEEIARVAQEEQNKKRGLRGFLMANNNVTRRRSRYRRTRKN